MARARCTTRRRSPAFTLAEAVVSMLLVGLTLAAALRTAGMSKSALLVQAEQARGHVLAEQLMQEIFLQPYSDPNADDGVFGPGATEKATGNRTLFDDVDDYHGWTASPPQYKNPPDVSQPTSIVMSELTNWTEEVTVTWCEPKALDTPSTTDKGVKRITVTIKARNRVVAQLVALRCGTPTTETKP